MADIHITVRLYSSFGTKTPLTFDRGMSVGQLREQLKRMSQEQRAAASKQPAEFPGWRPFRGGTLPELNLYLLQKTASALPPDRQLISRGVATDAHIDVTPNPEIACIIDVIEQLLSFGDHMMSSAKELRLSNSAADSFCPRCGSQTIGPSVMRDGVPHAWRYCPRRQCDFPMLEQGRYDRSGNNLNITAAELRKYLSGAYRSTGGPQFEQPPRMAGADLQSPIDAEALFEAAMECFEFKLKERASDKHKQHSQVPAPIAFLLRKFIGELQDLVANKDADPLSTFVQTHQPQDYMQHAAGFADAIAKSMADEKKEKAKQPKASKDTKELAERDVAKLKETEDTVEPQKGATYRWRKGYLVEGIQWSPDEDALRIKTGSQLLVKVTNAQIVQRTVRVTIDREISAEAGDTVQEGQLPRRDGKPAGIDAGASLSILIKALKKDRLFAQGGYDIEAGGASHSMLAALTRETEDGSKPVLSRQQLLEATLPMLEVDGDLCAGKASSRWSSFESLAGQLELHKELLVKQGDGDAVMYSTSYNVKSRAFLTLLVAWFDALEAARRNDATLVRPPPWAWAPAYGCTQTLSRTPSGWSLHLLVDSNEPSPDIDESLHAIGIPTQSRKATLWTGDFLFELKKPGSESKLLPIVIERKTWSDLKNSISGQGDDRYVNQTEKMVRCGLACKVYLVEGDVTAQLEQYESHLDALVMRGFHVVFTRNHFKTINMLGQLMRLFRQMLLDGRIGVGSCMTLEAFNARSASGAVDAGAAKKAKRYTPPSVCREVRTPGNFQYNLKYHVLPRQPAGDWRLPVGKPGCLDGLLFVTHGTMERIDEREMIDLIEGFGGDIRVGSSGFAWKEVDFLIRGYNGAEKDKLNAGEIMSGVKFKDALREKEKALACTRKPFAILKNDEGLFELIRTRSGNQEMRARAHITPGAAHATSAAASEDHALHLGPAAASIQSVEIWSVQELLDRIERGDVAGGAAGDVLAAPSQLIVCIGAHPGFAEARKVVFKESFTKLKELAPLACSGGATADDLRQELQRAQARVQGFLSKLQRWTLSNDGLNAQKLALSFEANALIKCLPDQTSADAWLSRATSLFNLPQPAGWVPPPVAAGGTAQQVPPQGQRQAAADAAERRANGGGVSSGSADGGGPSTSAGASTSAASASASASTSASTAASASNNAASASTSAGKRAVGTSGNGSGEAEKRQRALCSSCGKSVSITKGGAFHQHKNESGVPCDGRPPSTPAPAVAPAPQPAAARPMAPPPPRRAPAGASSSQAIELSDEEGEDADDDDATSSVNVSGAAAFDSQKTIEDDDDDNEDVGLDVDEPESQVQGVESEEQVVEEPESEPQYRGLFYGDETQPLDASEGAYEDQEAPMLKVEATPMTRNPKRVTMKLLEVGETAVVGRNELDQLHPSDLEEGRLTGMAYNAISRQLLQVKLLPGGFSGLPIEVQRCRMKDDASRIAIASFCNCKIEDSAGVELVAGVSRQLHASVELLVSLHSKTTARWVPALRLSLTRLPGWETEAQQEMRARQEEAEKAAAKLAAAEQAKAQRAAAKKAAAEREAAEKAAAERAAAEQARLEAEAEAKAKAEAEAEAAATAAAAEQARLEAKAKAEAEAAAAAAAEQARLEAEAKAKAAAERAAAKKAAAEKAASEAARAREVEAAATKGDAKQRRPPAEDEPRAKRGESSAAAAASPLAAPATPSAPTLRLNLVHQPSKGASVFSSPVTRMVTEVQKNSETNIGRASIDPDSAISRQLLCLSFQHDTPTVELICESKSGRRATLQRSQLESTESLVQGTPVRLQDGDVIWAHSIKSGNLPLKVSLSH